MRRSVLNLSVDFATLLVLLATAGTGLFLRFVLPPGSRGGAGLSLWGWTRHEWGDVHFYLILGLAALLTTHVALHWGWACSMARGLFVGRENRLQTIHPWIRNLSGAGFLIIISFGIGFLLWIASINVEEGRGNPKYGVDAGLNQPKDESLPSDSDPARGKRHMRRERNN